MGGEGLGWAGLGWAGAGLAIVSFCIIISFLKPPHTYHTSNPPQVPHNIGARPTSLLVSSSFKLFLSSLATLLASSQRQHSYVYRTTKSHTRKSHTNSHSTHPHEAPKPQSQKVPCHMIRYDTHPPGPTPLENSNEAF
ncbi:hypothetical protein B9Z19DRAFT_1060851 [Tuber borchii]|uniref:Uncharacterized protein n=1 Tax=Tuber borchii TaxID=42251 RepID=A0A2T7A719_TUBBO|nr:hypothetical protein B9Z19DRAFT_1060851 [Tuber borchii]